MALTINEINLYDRCEQGDAKSQMIIYDRYAKGMFNVALRIVNDKHLAEDLMQEGMITAFSKMGQWNRTATFGAWLKRIVINKCLSHLRKEKNYETVPYDQVTHEIVDPYNIIDGIDVKTNSSAQKALETIQSLKDSYREILILSLVEGMDNDEISEILGISNGTCRTTLSRAKDSLRKKMQKL